MISLMWRKGMALVMATLASRGIGPGLETVQEGWGHFEVVKEAK